MHVSIRSRLPREEGVSCPLAMDRDRCCDLFALTHMLDTMTSMTHIMEVDAKVETSGRRVLQQLTI